MYQKDKIQKSTSTSTSTSTFDFTFTFGNAVFKNLIKKNLLKKTSKSKEIQSILKRNQWSIWNGDYQKYNWQEIFSNMIECSAQMISIGYNNHFQILSQIQNTQFINLKCLYLLQNNINNIQSLSLIHFCCLQCLYLVNNQISTIKCFDRLLTPFLDDISLNSNPINQINTMPRTKLNSKKLKLLYLQRLNHQHSIIISQDLSVLVKLNSESIEQLYITSILEGINNINKSKRIEQDKVEKMLKMRFCLVQIQK